MLPLTDYRIIQVLLSGNFLETLKVNSYHYPYYPIGPNSWCKYNADKANNTQTYKPDPDLPRDIIYKIRPIFLELSKGSE